VLRRVTEGPWTDIGVERGETSDIHREKIAKDVAVPGILNGKAARSSPVSREARSADNVISQMFFTLNSVL
jgi:hypothetical protein